MQRIVGALDQLRVPKRKCLTKSVSGADTVNENLAVMFKYLAATNFG